jgi:hypothetical protein
MANRSKTEQCSAGSLKLTNESPPQIFFRVGTSIALGKDVEWPLESSMATPTRGVNLDLSKVIALPLITLSPKCFWHQADLALTGHPIIACFYRAGKSNKKRSVNCGGAFFN